jgi:hypothetical protein
VRAAALLTSMNSTADQLSPLASRVECGDAAAAEFYFERGLMVFTEAHHLRRGHCCGNGCRHCPYQKPE